MVNQRPLNFGVTFSLMLPQELYDAIGQTAGDSGRSKGDVAREWLSAGREVPATEAPAAEPVDPPVRRRRRRR